MLQRKDQNGFTLVEMLVGITLSAILITGFMTASTSMARSYRFSSNKMLEIRENRKAMEATFNQLRLASIASVAITNSNRSISYSTVDQNGTTVNRRIYLDTDNRIYQQITNGTPTLTRLYPEPVNNFTVTLGTDRTINILIGYTANTSMSVTVKPLNL